MDLNEKDFKAIDNALQQYATTGKIKENCPRCGGKLVYIQNGTSYRIECEKKGCISESFRGI
jgi:ssDNA-binding Zn-finger/Zn-ribbon topoisomerase 1